MADEARKASLFLFVFISRYSKFRLLFASIRVHSRLISLSLLVSIRGSLRPSFIRVHSRPFAVGQLVYWCPFVVH
jgi:hypothetical protein